MHLGPNLYFDFYNCSWEPPLRAVCWTSWQASPPFHSRRDWLVWLRKGSLFPPWLPLGKQGGIPQQRDGGWHLEMKDTSVGFPWPALHSVALGNCFQNLGTDARTSLQASKHPQLLGTVFFYWVALSLSWVRMSNGEVHYYFTYITLQKLLILKFFWCFRYQVL